jgi:uracil-DNA glycosylase
MTEDRSAEERRVIVHPIRWRPFITDSTTIPEIGLTMSPLGWESVFSKSAEEFEQIQKNIDQLETKIYYPQKKDLFRAFDLCPLDKVRVVILGQDPYHSSDNGVPQANGLCFSTSRSCKLQPSLMNIYKELKREYPDFVIPDHGDLTNWAYQGVLLLNTCLTVSPSVAGSHKAIWNGFIGRVFEAIAQVNPDCIFLLWGAKAQWWEKKIGQKSVKLMASHPSPFSAHKESRDSVAFLGCNHFRMVNEELERRGEKKIDWSRLD